jgi:hypothetical protein
MSTIQSTGWQAGFLAVMPAIETHAKIQFRRLPLEQREELIQESIASACAAYQRLAVQGKLHQAFPSSLATYAVKQARSGRHVGGHQDAAKDVMSPACHRRHEVRIISYHRHRVPARSGFGCQGWKQLTIADRRDPIPDTVAFRIDFGTWLKEMTRRDRRIIAGFICRERSMDLAEKFNLSPARISQLRRRYEQQWAVFQGEASGGKAA